MFLGGNLHCCLETLPLLLNIIFSHQTSRVGEKTIPFFSRSKIFSGLMKVRVQGSLLPQYTWLAYIRSLVKVVCEPYLWYLRQSLTWLEFVAGWIMYWAVNPTSHGLTPGFTRWRIIFHFFWASTNCSDLSLTVCLAFACRTHTEINLHVKDLMSNFLYHISFHILKKAWQCDRQWHDFETLHIYIYRYGEI